MHRRELLIAAGASAALAALAPPASLAAGPALAQADLASQLAGEWNNNEQVWQQGIDAADPKRTQPVARSAHLHHVIVPVAAPRIGAQVFVAHRRGGGDSGAAPAALRIWAAAAGATTKLDAWRFKDKADEARFAELHRKPELAAGLDPSLLERAAGEAVELRDGLLVVAGAADGVPASSRRVRYFEGWVWIKNAGPTAAPDDKRASFTRKVQLHSEGQKIPVMFEDGTASPYLLELALLTYQNTKKPILKFALVDKASGKSVAYTWANPDASLIGMNLGWFQSGMTQKAERVHYGF